LKKHFAIAGPLDSPYEGYWFRISIQIPTDYPYRPPTEVKMLDKVWNPYFDPLTGEICIDILDDQWSPSYNLEKLLISIISLMSETKIDLEVSSFLNPQAAI
jgi:ubiquitin-protein ligase